MGITIVQKSNLKEKKPKAKRALVLAGGALTGASFKIGGLKAFNDYFQNFQITDFDIFMGISSGSLLATALSGGLTPEEMLKSLDGSSKKFSRLEPWHFYWPNWEEFLVRPVRYAARATTWLPGVLWRLVTKLPMQKNGMKELFWDFVKHPTLSGYENLWEMMQESALQDHHFPSLLECLPSGMFDNGPLERYLRMNIRHNKMTNNFKLAAKVRGKKLYITAMTLDGAEEVVFGADEKSDVSISRAVQASSAMPGFYKPVKIGDQYYVDGGVKHTANLDLMVDKGAKLIVCYNPFRPYENKTFVDTLSTMRKGPRSRSLTDEGVFAVLNQFFRTVFHTRLHSALRLYEQKSDFDGDIILIEPGADDQAFFSMNPFGLGHRLHAAQLGFESVRNSIEEQYPKIAKIMASYGIEMSRKGVEAEYKKIHTKEPDPILLKKILEGNKGTKRGEKKTKRA
ncbi:MAG: patatin-like phospholipase family protein [Deltaproteobacteria bacterium]|nr:patatin-like phospholipase family protein [Deltaproteobacteria bacterium]